MSNARDGLATLALATLVARVLRLGGRAIRRPGYYAALARRLMTVHGAVGAWQIALGRPRAAPLRCDISPRSPPPSAGAADPVRILLSQTILPPGGTARLEALAYTGDGTILAIASTARSEILLYRRQGDGRFGDRPALVLGGFMSGFGEPHGIDIFTREGQEFMAVANRLGWISLHRRLLSGTFARRPDHIIAGPRTELCDSDAVAAVPPFNDMLAVCNLTTGAVSFHRAGPEGNRAPPVAVLCHPHLHRPEGLAFSACGKFLAVGCHGSSSVLIFARSGAVKAGEVAPYGPEPLALLRDAALAHPHGLRFLPGSLHLLVTNAGANHASLYRNISSPAAPSWSAPPSLIGPILPLSMFRQINKLAPMDGGPKGVAVHQGEIALCSQEMGIQVLRLAT